MSTTESNSEMEKKMKKLESKVDQLEKRIDRTIFLGTRRKKFTDKEIAIMNRMVRDKKKIKEIAEVLGRSPDVVKSKITSLQLREIKRKVKRKEEVEEPKKEAQRIPPSLKDPWEKVLADVGAKLEKWNRSEVYTIGGKPKTVSEIREIHRLLVQAQPITDKKISLCKPSFL